MPSEEKYLKISFDAKIGFVFTVPHEATEDKGCRHTFQMNSPSRSIKYLQQIKGRKEGKKEEIEEGREGGKEESRKGRKAEGLSHVYVLEHKFNLYTCAPTNNPSFTSLHSVDGYFLFIWLSPPIRLQFLSEERPFLVLT